MPRPHSWDIVCDTKGLRIDEQIEAVLRRLRPVEEALVAVTRSGECSAVLQIIRYLDHPDGAAEELPDGTDGLEKLPGQHQLLGWGLDQHDLAFVVRLDASIDVDEYSSDPLS